MSLARAQVRRGRRVSDGEIVKERQPPGLIRKNVLDRYNEFRPKRAEDTSADEPPEWEPAKRRDMTCRLRLATTKQRARSHPQTS